ncbi:MAG: restriction endonuclease subunit S [Spirosomataceae bacterium]|jgi:type I restriction enzyme S subunit
MQVKLSQILSSLESGGRPKGGASLDNKGIPSLGAEHLDSNGGFNFKSVKYIPEDYFNGLKNGIIEKENILIVKDGATTGKVSYVTEDFPFEKASVNEHVFLLKIDKSKAYPRFAFHYLKCPQGQRDIMRDFRGATVGGISRGFVDFVKFELPPLPDQLHIANLLSKAENLIAQRKESIRLLDEFLKSTFLEMFGDPIANKKKWKSLQVSDYGESRLGKMLDGKKIIGNNLKPYLRNSNVLWFEFKLDELLEMDFDEKDRVEFSLKNGDILMCEGGEIGRCAIWRDELNECYFQKAIHRIRLNKNIVLPEYFVYMFWLYTINGGLNKYMGAATISHLTGEKLKKMKLPISPIELQTQFTQIVEKTEALKAQYQQSLQELENMYGSLSQKAFRGELGVKQLAKA